MSEVSYVTQAGIFFSCLDKKQLVLEQIIPEHILTHVYEGKISVTTADKTYTLSAGQTALFSRNQLASDFSEPHKIDLSDFLHQNFMFNISISRFAYLTSRSLATFKRDFKKTFGTSPQKWLTEKRLQQAHFLIAEKNHKPSQAYLESGFESFSHFTYAFKKFFGYNPSSILSR